MKAIDHLVRYALLETLGVTLYEIEQALAKVK